MWRGFAGYEVNDRVTLRFGLASTPDGQENALWLMRLRPNANARFRKQGILLAMPTKTNEQVPARMCSPICLSRSTLRPDTAGASSVSGTRVAFADARSVAGRPRMPPRLLQLAPRLR